MDEKEFYGRIKELEKRFSELMDDLKAIVEEFEAFKEEARQAEEEAEEKSVKRRGTYKKLLFRRDLSVQFIIDEFVRTYEWFFSEQCHLPLEGKCVEKDFFAYLYLVAYKKGWFDEDTKERNKQTFAKFIREEAFRHLKLNFNNKTFLNRLKSIREYCEEYMEEGVKIPVSNDFHVRNFKKINDMVEDCDKRSRMKRIYGR